MRSIADHPLARGIAGVLGIVGSIADGLYFVLYPMLVVPSPANYGFYVAWLVPLGLSVRWWRSHPWRALAVPIVAALLVNLARIAGEQLFGWAP
jgi:hypothetical protein